MRIALRFGCAVFALVVGAGLGAAPGAAEEVVEMVKTGCATELKSYCKDVAPGEGRILACFYAHNDKLSSQCSYALIDAHLKVQMAINVLTHLAEQCVGDIGTHCGDIQAGQGRIYQCLTGKKADLTEGCRSALSKIKIGAN